MRPCTRGTIPSPARCSSASPRTRGQALARRAHLQAVNRIRRIAEAEQLAGQALAAAASACPDAERRALVALAWARVLRGRGVEDLLERSAAVPPGTVSLYHSSVGYPAGMRLAFRGELARARDVFGGLLAAAEERGEARSGMTFTVHLFEIELRVGDTFAATRALDEVAQYELAQWAALEPVQVVGWRVQAALAAVRGDPGRAAALAARVQASGLGASEWERLEALRAAGLAALLARDPERAAGSLAAVWEHTVREGVEDPGVFPVAGDLAEALAEAGRTEEADRVIGRLRRLAAAQQHPWGLATADRSAAVVTLAGGYDEAAAAGLARAAAAYRALGLGFDAARALLVLGRAKRRAKKRAAARQSLEQARSGFEALGCPGWAQAAAAEAEPGQRPPRRARRRADPGRAAGRRAGGRRPVQQGSRRPAVPVRGHRRHAPARRVRQARHPLPHPARPPPGRPGLAPPAGPAVTIAGQSSRIYGI